jgi:hypothetical protein
MKNQRKILKGLKANYKEKLENLKGFAREFEARCTECDPDDEHIAQHKLKLENDTKYYESEIERITALLRASRKESDQEAESAG